MEYVCVAIKKEESIYSRSRWTQPVVQPSYQSPGPKWASTTMSELEDKATGIRRATTIITWVFMFFLV